MSDYPNVKVDELVLLRDDTVRQDLRPLERIENIYPGKYGIPVGTCCGCANQNRCL